MAKQKITPGGSIETVTPGELNAAFTLQAGDSHRGYSGLLDVVAGDFDHPEPVLLLSPPARRLRITRHGRGGDAISVSTSLLSICVPNEGRMGLQLVNYGSNNLFVYLAGLDDLQAAGGGVTVPALWLAKGGGSWDGEFAECLWGGSVTVKADAATTTITLVEI